MCFNLRNAAKKLPKDILTGSPLRVLTEICDQVRKGTNFSYPSRREMADNLGCHERTVTSAIKILCCSKFISVEKRYRDDGSQSSNRYIVNIEKIKSLTTYKKEPAEKPVDKGVEEIATPVEEIAMGGGSEIQPINDHINLKNNTPKSPEGDAKAEKLPKTKNPYKSAYNPTESDKKQILEVWNEVAKGRYRGCNHVRDLAIRNLRKSYALYLKRSKDNKQIKTMTEFACTLIAAFDNAVVSSSQPEFYYREHPINGRDWSPSLDYVFRLATYEKIINEEI